MEYPNKIIRMFSKEGELVMAIKAKLNEKIDAGLDSSSPVFGLTTFSAVVMFQKKQRLVGDGEVGELTWNRLFSVPDNANAPVVENKLGLLALEEAKTQLFVRELTGKNDGKEVEQFLSMVGLPRSYSWCMAFVYAMFDRASKKLGVANPVPKTAGVLDCFRRANKSRVKSPSAGDQFIMDFGRGLGHTGIISSVSGSRIFTVEGNTSADPSYKGEDREGNGVFERNRNITSITAFLRYK